MNAWQALSSDPNAPELSRMRQEKLSQAGHQPLIEDRVSHLCALVKGRSVLDVGIVEHMLDASKSSRWLHRHIRAQARECLGIDILEKEICQLQSEGYNVRCWDVLKEPLPAKYETIVCGEVLEHVEAPGKLMENCARMLLPQGLLVITVPNPWYANVLLKNLSGKTIFVDSADHVAWFDPATMFELGARYGLMLERYAGLKVERGTSWRSKLFITLYPVLVALGFKRELFAKSILYEFRLST